MKLTEKDLLRVTNVQAMDFGGRKPLTVTGVTIDSRSVRPGDLFVALKGERVDGHDFITRAIEAGAAAVVLGRTWTSRNEALMLSLPVPRLVVEDTVKALGELARVHRRKFDIPVIAVGGSNGKTTTKDMIKAVLGTRSTVLATEGNLNNHLGVPLTLFRLEKKHKVAVVEIGTNHPGEISYLCDILLPTHGLLTNIGAEHLEFFRTFGGVAKAEGELFDWLKTYRAKSSKIFINADDRFLAKRIRSTRSAVTFGFKATRATVRGVNLTFSERAQPRFQVKSGSRSFMVELSVPGLHSAMNALAAITVGLTFRVSPANIRRALHALKPTGKRMEVVEMGGVTVLNDTYNSNPDSVRAALQTIGAMKTAGKRIAVLADMLELGPDSAGMHRQAAHEAAKNGVEYLLTYGPLSRETHTTSNAKFKAHYDQKNMLSEYLSELLSPGDIVLIKGSRGMKMEDVVTFLRERFSKAA
ncbi:MAG: UDP-N-acetylmuramoyl-tripeptide--D-alanyl-D-alanine ligase [Bacteroidota bacterium]